MLDLTSRSVSFALLLGQLLAGEISRSAFLDRASPLGAGSSEASPIWPGASDVSRIVVYGLPRR